MTVREIVISVAACAWGLLAGFFVGRDSKDSARGGSGPAT